MIINDNYIKPQEYSKNKNIKHLVFGNNVYHIGISAFNGCTELETIEFGENIKSIDCYAFYGCSNLKSLVFNKKCDKIGSYAFCLCGNLESIDLENSTELEALYDYTFYGCKSLNTIKLHPAIKYIHKTALPKHIDPLSLSCLNI